MQDKHLVCGSVVILLLLVVVTGVCLIKRGNSENFCTNCVCSGLEKKTCQNKEELQRLYNEGVLTEFTNFPEPTQRLPDWANFHTFSDTPENVTYKWAKVGV